MASESIMCAMNMAAIPMLRCSPATSTTNQRRFTALFGVSVSVAAQIAAVEAQEKSLVEELDVTSLEALDASIASSLLHPYHFIFFWALDDLNSICVEEDFPDVELAKIYRRILECLNYTLPYPHDEKVQHYDHLAQTLISIGDVAGAKEAYEHAYALSCLCSGKDYDE
ncbi:hypothetical protein AC1031_020809 [Aphanomyces cochlioides]|nr:hypothetical protein AC1031_020809 [Aphanomyces cochlioides]